MPASSYSCPPPPCLQVVLLNTHHEERLHSDPAIMAREQAMLVRELDSFTRLVEQQHGQQGQHTDAAAGA